MRVAVAGIPGAWSTELLADSLRNEGIEAFTLSLADVLHDLGEGRVLWQQDDLRDLDGVVVKKLGDQAAAASRLRLHPLRALEAQGVRIFSRPDVIDLAMDRYRMTMRLAEAGIPIPPTFAAESEASLDAAIAAIGDGVVKPVYTSKGRGMMRVPAGDSPVATALAAERYLVQRFVDAPGRDIGATVIGGVFVGAFYRIASDGEWMTTTDRGGRYEPCKLSDAGAELAERAAAAFGLDYTVVDLVEQGHDFLCYEVSAFGGFRGLWEASRVGAAAAYARYIKRTLLA